MTLVTDTQALAAACERLRGADYVTIDTEFHRESTYWPQLCLAQVSGNSEAWAVDALAPGIDLAPLLTMLNDPTLPKVFHAGRQDVEIFLHLSGKVPQKDPFPQCKNVQKYIFWETRTLDLRQIDVTEHHFLNSPTQEP